MRYLLALVSLAACEQGPLPDPVMPTAPPKPPVTPEPVTEPAIAPSRDVPIAFETEDGNAPKTYTFEQLTAHRPVPPGFPAPPSIEPKAYAEWLKGLPAMDRKRIAIHCKKHTTDFQTVCGGIGPQHIPYPPMMRARVQGEDSLHSMYASMKDWQSALSKSQLKYIETHCRGGEEQPSSDLCGDNTPLVVAFDDQAVAFSATASTFAFAPGHPATTDWPTAATPWLALDRDGDGAITSGAELFGNNSPLPNSAHAANGFSALATLDANGDGVIDAHDPAFASLVLWADANGDRRSTPDELRPAADVLDALSLANRIDARCDTRSNCEGERAALTWHDTDGTHRGTLVDVYLPTR